MFNPTHLACFGLFLSTAVLPFATTINYPEDGTNFPNPERGYFTTNLSASSLQSAKKQGMTLVRKYYRLDAYVSTDILPQSVFDALNKDAGILRQEGAKMITRFAYNFGTCSDAPLARILTHIDQLTPVLRANSDVIAFIETGFIGRWGEWHHSQCPDPNQLDNTAARTAVLSKLLSAVPDRMVALRYNYHKRDLFGQASLGPDLAFSGANAARTGNHNDCFVSSANDVGTYQGSQSIEWQKTFLNQDNRYVPQGGETCATSALSNCASSMADFKRMHWDVINSAFHSGVINGWKNEGCNADIQKLLGYRIKMTSAQVPAEVRPGSAFTGTIHLVNIGWGKIYNTRGCELVFRNTVTKNKFIVKLAHDPRQWSITESEVAVNISALIPSSTPEGLYQVFLNLPDTASRLYGKPAYSIRLANTGVWEDSTGYNSLLHTVSISSSASVHNKTLSQTETKFSFSMVKKNQQYALSIHSPDDGPVVIEIFTPEGRRLVNQQIDQKQGNEFVFGWVPPARTHYLIKVRQGNHYQEAFTPF